MADQAELSFAAQLEVLRSEQNLVAAVAAGLIAAVAGAAIWAAVTALTNYQIGWMAIGVGFIVGYAIRVIGKGIDPIFGVTGAALSLLGCLLGNYLTVVWLVADDQGAGFFEVLMSLGAADIVNLMQVTFDPMDLLFYGIAVYFGYRYSIHVVSAPLQGRERQE